MFEFYKLIYNRLTLLLSCFKNDVFGFLLNNIYSFHKRTETASKTYVLLFFVHIIAKTNIAIKTVIVLRYNVFLEKKNLTHTIQHLLFYSVT